MTTKPKWNKTATMGMNKYTGEEITSIPEPTLTLDIVKDLLGKEAVSSLKQPLEEYANPQ